MACDISWKSNLSTINEESVLLKTQVDYVVKERESIKLKYQKLFISIKATRTQHQKELDELIEHVNQKTYAYADVWAQNQDLLITISELKKKLKTIDKGKNVNTKFDKSETSGTLLCVTPLPKNIAVKAKKVSNTKVNTNSSNSVRRPKYKDTKPNDRVLKNTNDKRPSAHVRKMSSKVSIDSNKRETVHSDVCQSNASVLNTKTVNAINDGSNIVCVSCGKDVFLLSHEKCVASYALSRYSKVKRALFTTAIIAKSKNLRATSIVSKSRLSVAKTPTATNKNRSIVHTRYNKTPYELIPRKKPNVQYFHVFGSLCYPTNDRNDLGKMKPKADIGIFIGYSESSRGFRIYNCQTKNIMETIHVKFDELTTMASECNNSGPDLNYSNFQDSSDEMNEIPSHQDLDNLFGPLYEEYYAPSTFEVSNNSVANTLDDEDTPSPSAITVEDSDALQIARPTEKLLKDVKMIFQYLRQSINKGLWYSKDSGFELIAYSDADIAGCLDDYKSTSGGIRFLGDKLVSWSSKKHDCTSMSTAELSMYVFQHAAHKSFG
ncbi:retrovirus-related pol polyprotein from transposon TNT 1-94 [Tanacetum coccineum]